ncbi:MAG: 5-oxoprolinase subunit PxpB [Bacteroidota bacterium]
MEAEYRIKPYGDRALLVVFRQEIDPNIHRKVGQLENWAQATPLPGLEFSIPAYCSWVLGFDPDLVSFSTLKSQIEHQLKKQDPTQQHGPARLWKLPVCYEAPYSPDLPWVADYLALSQEEVILRHTSQSYQVYMLGFLPGFAYMGSLPDELQIPRKAQPRTEVPAQSVAIAGAQTSIYPLDSPGGWQLIGRCPVPVLDLKKDPFSLFQAGDQVGFYPVSNKDYQQMEADLRHGTLTVEEFGS